MIDETTISDGVDSLESRQQVGRTAIIAAGWNGSTEYDGWLEDVQTYSTDAISDILTFVVGPAGVTKSVYNGADVSYNVEHDGEALDKARELLDDALRSWEGDAEDYIVEVDESDTTDLDRLTRLWALSLQATCAYERGFHQGQFAEYVSQNAVDEDVAARARVEASKQVYGNGPKDGLQC